MPRTTRVNGAHGTPRPARSDSPGDPTPVLTISPEGDFTSQDHFQMLKDVWNEFINRRVSTRRTHALCRLSEQLRRVRGECQRGSGRETGVA